jgi:hypothetical protein
MSNCEQPWLGGVIDAEDRMLLSTRAAKGRKTPRSRKGRAIDGAPNG